MITTGRFYAQLKNQTCNTSIDHKLCWFGLENYSKLPLFETHKVLVIAPGMLKYFNYNKKKKGKETH